MLGPGTQKESIPTTANSLLVSGAAADEDIWKLLLGYLYRFIGWIHPHTLVPNGWIIYWHPGWGVDPTQWVWCVRSFWAYFCCTKRLPDFGMRVWLLGGQIRELQEEMSLQDVSWIGETTTGRVSRLKRDGKNSASRRERFLPQIRIRFADDQTKEMGEMGLWTHGFCGSFSVGKAAIFGEDSVSLFRCPRTPNRLQDLKSEILNKRVIQSDFCGPFFKATGNSKISPLWYF